MKNAEKTLALEAFTQSSEKVSVLERKIYPVVEDGLQIIGKEQKFDFTGPVSRHMSNPARAIPIHVLDQVIKSPMVVLPDPKNAFNAMMHYSRMWKNGKIYNVEVLYDESTNRPCCINPF